MNQLNQKNNAIKQYIFITANYWAFTLTDGALRMLVLLHFYQLGYDSLSLALLFLLYEFFGVLTNLVGGWLGARYGLNKTMHAGLILQVFALAMLLPPNEFLTITWVMLAQALSGIAKDLNKMSAKSALKLLVPKQELGTLYKWVAILTGSKNSLKGLGFFLGAGLLALFNFQIAILIMLIGLMFICIASFFLLTKDLGRASYKAKFSQLFSSSRPVNLLAAARLCLFASRDVWFAVALPVHLASKFQWQHWQIGTFMALWIIAYGLVQSFAPKITGLKKDKPRPSLDSHPHLPDGRSAVFWASLLILAPLSLTLFNYYQEINVAILISGLFLFGFIFAVNSSMHSYLIISYAKEDGVSLDVGFYYMANAAGRLLGTVLSGYSYMHYGFTSCLLIASGFILLTALISLALPQHKAAHT